MKRHAVMFIYSFAPDGNSCTVVHVSAIRLQFAFLGIILKSFVSSLKELGE